jgi:hypothetical protein
VEEIMEKEPIKELIEEWEKRQRELEIARYKDEIEAFRWWQSEEAKCRIISNVLSLNRLGVTEIDISFCYLEKARLGGIKLNGADIGRTNLKEAILKNADLRKACISNANLQAASLAGADLSAADLFSAELRESDLRETKLKDALLNEADLRGAKSLTIKQLSEAHTLYLAKMDDDLMEQVKSSCPRLLVHPDLM